MGILYFLSFVIAVVSSRSTKFDICDKVKCNFEQGTACGYTSSFDHDLTKDTPTFTLQLEDYGTGDFKISGPEVGSKVYLGTVLTPGKLSYVISPEFNTTKERKVKFRYYVNTPGIFLKGCLTAESEKCQLIAQGSLNETNWRSGSYDIPAGSKKFGLLADNRGANTGAVGIDNISVVGC